MMQREVKDDLLKEWIDFREETAFCEMTPQDKNIVFILKRLQKKYLKMFRTRIRNMFKNNWINLIKTLWTTYIIGMKSIIEMDLQM